MSDDSISRRAAIDALNKLDVSDGVGISSVACDLQEEAIRSIENLPFVEPERKKGKWICLQRHYHKCSVCGNFLDFRGVNAGRGDANFCPNCGADMRGEEK